MIRFYTIHHCRYCLQSLAIKYTRKDTAFRTELSQGLSAISCVYYKTYTSFKGAKIQIYFYNKKLFFEFFIRRAIWNGGNWKHGRIWNVSEFGMWANLEWGRLEIGAICNMGKFVIGVICNMGDLQIAPTTCAKEPIPCPWCLFCVFTRMFANVLITPV